MKQDSFDQPSSFGLPVCPYCGKRLNPVVAWLYKTKGEYLCPHCSQFSTVSADPKTPLFGILAVAASLAIFLIFLFANGKLPLWAISLLVAPFLVFTCLAPFLVRLEKIQAVPQKLKEPERPNSQRNKGQRSLPKVTQEHAASQSLPQRPAPSQRPVNPDSPYAHPASRPPQYRNPQPPKNYNSAQRPAPVNRPVQTNRPAAQPPMGNRPMQTNRPAAQPPMGNRPMQANRPAAQPPVGNRPMQTNRPAAKPNLYPSVPPRGQKPAPNNRPAGSPSQKANPNRPVSPNLFDTAEFGKRPPKDFSGYQDQ